MPGAPLPPDVLAFLAKAHPAVIASVRPDGSPHSVPTWYDLEDDGLVLLNMEETRLRLSFIRLDPRVSLTVLDAATWYTHVSLLGRIVRIRTTPTWPASTDSRAGTRANRSGDGMRDG